MQMASSSTTMLSTTMRRCCHASSVFRGYATATKDPLVTALQQALKDSMRAKDTFRSQVLKSGLADIQNFQHEKSPPPPLHTLINSVGKRKDALRVYAEQNRQDIVEQYRKEIAILEEFVPEDAREMSNEDLAQLVEKVIADLAVAKGADAKNSLSKVIKEVRARAGMRAQNLGKQISESVKQALS